MEVPQGLLSRTGDQTQSCSGAHKESRPHIFGQVILDRSYIICDHGVGTAFSSLPDL